MENIIKSVVECDSAYGIVALAVTFLGFTLLGFIAYKTIQIVLPCLYNITCKICNTIKTYKEVHTKAEVRDISFETDLHR